MAEEVEDFCFEIQVEVTFYNIQKEVRKQSEDWSSKIWKRDACGELSYMIA